MTKQKIKDLIEQLSKIKRKREIQRSQLDQDRSILTLSKRQYMTGSIDILTVIIEELENQLNTKKKKS